MSLRGIDMTGFKKFTSDTYNFFVDRAGYLAALHSMPDGEYPQQDYLEMRYEFFVYHGDIEKYGYFLPYEIVHFSPVPCYQMDRGPGWVVCLNLSSKRMTYHPPGKCPHAINKEIDAICEILRIDKNEWNERVEKARD